MNPEIKPKWLDALRSNKFKQGKNALKSEDEYSGETYYCCLGVLCELAVEAGVEVKVETPEQSGYKRYWSFDGDYETLPSSVQEWAGIDGVGNIDVAIPYAYDNLAELNDSGIPFTEIADIIEKEF